MGTIGNIAKGVFKKIEGAIQNPYKKLGYNWFQVRRIKNLPDHKLYTIPFLDRKISFFSRYEFIHSAEEIFLNELYKQQLPADARIIDCGANIGLSVIYLKKLCPTAQITAFEPDAKNFKLMRANLRAFNMEDVDCRQQAVWIENTVLNFESRGNMMSHVSDSASQQTEKVNAVRLKDFLQEKVDFLKIDIEGAEYKVVKDIIPELAMVENFFLEYHGTFQQNNELNELFLILQAAGFKYYIRHAIDKYPTPFVRNPSPDYDVQLNIFAFRN